MGRKKEEPTERINFELDGELAHWLQEMKNRGIIVNNPEAVRFALLLLRHHYEQTGVRVEPFKNTSDR